MDYDIDKLVANLDFNKNHFVDCGNGLLLTNFEIEVLNKYKIDYKTKPTLKNLLSQIEQVLNDGIDEDLDDLDQVSKSIEERDYYLNSNK